MSETARILISNIALPTKKIGSWTTRMSQFLENNPQFFDIILSPNFYGENYIFCKKRSFITWRKKFRKLQLCNWVALDYIKQVKKLSKQYRKLVIVVMDDLHLAEAFSDAKNRFNCEIELVYSFHGFHLKIDNKILSSIDKILFLSKMGYEESRKNLHQYPKSFVVGNAVNSEIFYPLEDHQFKNARIGKGYNETDEILIWMANDRPKKGLHIFEAVIEDLLRTHKDLKVIIIGSKKTSFHKNVNSVGRITNTEVSSYLQISNYYMFTTLYQEGFGLSMIEALKCGNSVIASSRGAIPEVLNNLDNTYLIEDVEDINSWRKGFNLARTKINFDKLRPKRLYTDKIWGFEDWELKFKNAID